MANRNNAAQRERERQQRERERQQRERQQREAQQRAQREAQQRAQRESQQRAQREAQQRNQQKNKDQGVKAAIRQASDGGVTRKELQQIQKQTGASSAQIVKRMDAMNKAGQDVRLNAGAANTIVKQAQKAPYDPFGRQPSFGTGNIARALQGMIGTPGYTAPRNPQSGAPYGGSRPAVPGTGLLAGGMQIRKGGRPAVRRQVLPAAAPAAPAPVDTGIGDGGTGDGGDMSGFDFASLFDEMFGGMDEPMMPEMPALESFDQLSSNVETRDPLQLAALGQSYAGDMIRAKQRQAQGRRAYMRGGQTAGGGLSPLAALLTIGGLTL